MTLILNISAVDNRGKNGSQEDIITVLLRRHIHLLRAIGYPIPTHSQIVSHIQKKIQISNNASKNFALFYPLRKKGANIPLKITKTSYNWRQPNLVRSTSLMLNQSHHVDDFLGTRIVFGLGVSILFNMATTGLVTS
ncbi:hypothetical protein ACJX0J_033209, partial [Zea mays]